MVYRVVPAVDGEQKFEDHVGRQILWIEGVVLKGVGTTLVNAGAAFQEVHEIVFEDYRKFWDSTTNATTKRSHSFSVQVEQEPILTDVNLPTRPLPHLGLRRLLLVALLGILLFLGVGVILKLIIPVNKTAPDIEAFKDANGKTYPLKTLSGNVVMLIMGNSSIRVELDKWANAFWNDYKKQKRVKAFVIIDVEGDAEKPAGSKENSAVVLFDYDGKVHRAYGVKKGKPNLFLIDSMSNIVFDMKANFDRTSYQKLQKQINHELKNLDQGCK
jgi:hypothetical protein